ncbi:microtubule binding motor protein [Lithospermum erythrorhizon]|uniref:Microtubule binding motor protein n=1 Tax=Lithospermum erythrorhizon TaxID=34254 RepID=A0AAV3PCK9_LITER
MPGLIIDEIHEESHEVGVTNGFIENGSSVASKENVVENIDHENGLTTPSSENGGIETEEETQIVEPSIQQLYENVCEMQSSDRSPSRRSFGSYGDESNIDSELRYLVGGVMREVEIIEEDEEEVQKPENVEDSLTGSGSKKESSSGKVDNSQSASSNTQEKSKKLSSDTSGKSSSKSPQESTSMDNKKEKKGKKAVTGGTLRKPRNSKYGTKEGSGSDNPELGPLLLKQAKDLLSSGDNPQKALALALRATKSFEKYCNSEKPNLDAVMCLHVTAAIYCNLGQYGDAIPLLEQSLQIPVIEEGEDHALAKFAGYMQLGDTYALVGQLENSIMSYMTGLEVQRKVLGETDPRVGETCRYLAEAHVQALRFDEAEKLCQIALDIHISNGSPASLEEAADRRLMALICETKGDHEAALEHLVLASMAMVANGQEAEVASVDCSIGDTYLSLKRYDEAIHAYEKALKALKSSKGENHPAVASVFVRLADLYNKTGQFRDSKTYCENALKIYGKPLPGMAPEETASGLTDISAIYESMNELEPALKLLQKALKVYQDTPGHQSTIAGIEAQMGVIHYMLGSYRESCNSFKSSISKLRANGGKKSAFFGVALNQMGLACVQLYAVNEAIELFEEARGILEQECGPYHPDTLGVYSNLAGTYDAVGRLDDSIEVLEHVVGMREEKLGTANPDVDDEKTRLAELLKEAGRARNRKARSLENLLDSNHLPNNMPINGSGIKV